MDGANFGKCQWLDLILKICGCASKPRCERNNTMHLFCLRAEPKRKKWNMQWEINKNELPQRIFLKSNSEPTFPTFVNWDTHTNALHPQQKHFRSTCQLCNLWKPYARQKTRKLRNVGKTWHWNHAKPLTSYKKTVANSISPILHPSRCVLAFKPTAPQTNSSRCAHFTIFCWTV